MAKKPYYNVWMCSRDASVAFKEKKIILFYILLYNFIWFHKYMTFIDIKQTLHYKVAIE